MANDGEADPVGYVVRAVVGTCFAVKEILRVYRRPHDVVLDPDCPCDIEGDCLVGAVHVCLKSQGRAVFEHSRCQSRVFPARVLACGAQFA